jgi:hypothetical protein
MPYSWPHSLHLSHTLLPHLAVLAQVISYEEREQADAMFNPAPNMADMAMLQQMQQLQGLRQQVGAETCPLAPPGSKFSLTRSPTLTPDPRGSLPSAFSHS